MNRPNARIACQTPDGSVVRTRLADLDALREFLRLHPEAREYFLDLDGRTYHLQPTGNCPDWDDPRLSVIDDRYRDTSRPALDRTERHQPDLPAPIRIGRTDLKSTDERL